MTRKARRKKSQAVSASKLAQMGVCERLVRFEHRYGKRRTASQRAAIRHGLKEHDDFYRGGLRTSDKKGWCYIATLIFGPKWENAAVRIFRDRALRPYGAGRWLIGMYYRTAPRICEVLERWPWLQPILRTILRPIAWMVYRMPRSNRRDHVI